MNFSRTWSERYGEKFITMDLLNKIIWNVFLLKLETLLFFSYFLGDLRAWKKKNLMSHIL